MIPDPEVLHAHCNLLNTSFTKLLGRPLVEDTTSGSLVNQMLNAPFVIVSHNTENDPIFNFANHCALNLWKMNWEEFTSLPSRYSAEAMERGQREAFLKQAQEKGYVDQYSGIRIAKDGKRFRISDAIIWNLHDDESNFKGQAATFNQWEYL
ncbi:MEKHLA domain-containing protein [Cytophagaceae bacterium ABcell3]|nr:MEKHLA domain-containing protein [Cytophagaceae bacterium ABcell3]